MRVWYTESRTFMVDGEMTSELMHQIQQWGSKQGYDRRDAVKPTWVKAVLPPLQIMDGVFETLDDVQRYLDSQRDAYFIAFRCREYHVSHQDYADALTRFRVAVSERTSFLDSVAPWNRVSRTFTCKSCGRVLSCDELRRAHTYYCSCGAIQLSATNRDRLKRMSAKIQGLNDACLRLQRGEPTERTCWVVHCCFSDV